MQLSSISTFRIKILRAVVDEPVDDAAHGRCGAEEVGARTMLKKRDEDIRWIFVWEKADRPRVDKLVVNADLRRSRLARDVHIASIQRSRRAILHRLPHAFMDDGECRLVEGKV